MEIIDIIYVNPEYNPSYIARWVTTSVEHSVYTTLSTYTTYSVNQVLI